MGGHFPFLRLRKYEEQEEKDRRTAKRRDRARLAVRQRLARFLQRIGFSDQDAQNHSSSPPVDLLESSHPDLERYLEICCEVREADLGLDDETLERDIQEEDDAAQRYTDERSNAAGAKYRNWTSPWHAGF